MAISERRRAGPPFNDDEADIILRSSDGVDLYVSKAILAKALPVFAELCGGPHPPKELADEGDYVGESPVMSMAESYGDLQAVLRSCYPACPIYVHGLDGVAALLLGAEKYDIERAKREGTEQLSNLAKPEAQPFGAYVVAARFGLSNIMRSISKQSVLSSTFDKEMAKIKQEDCAFLRLADSRILHALWNFHWDCRLRVEKLTEVGGWIDGKSGKGWLLMWNFEPMRCCRESREMVWLHLGYDEDEMDMFENADSAP